ncbi:MAG: MarR family transcriptional regulator [Rhodocyclaceae bacterium]|jgi:DNA-binding MarR family transcriptional regulator|nr:MarR family transcriptional regulator [Rhodocyclaceae bacterium]MCL4758505.1 MarR family transcriptional regulator [Rhodocyclaceae bacterium]
MTRKKRSETPSDLDYGMLPNLAGYQLRLAQVAIFRDFSESLGEFDVTPGLFGVLVIIEANPGLKQSELARATHLDRSTVVSVIDNLERRNLVVRRPAQNDRRSNALTLTERGSTLLQTLKARVEDHEARLVAHLTESERTTLVSLLRKIFPEHR